MERLTNSMNGLKYLKAGCIDGEYFQKIIDKLAEYENTELEPEDVQNLAVKWQAKEVHDHIRELLEMKKQGRLLILNAPIEEIIRCTLCANHMKSDRGCDGNCQVDEYLYKSIIKAILNE